MSTIEQVDVFAVKIPHHYKIAGHEQTPGRLPGTDYYIEPQWSQVYSRATESCLVKVTSSDGATGWGEAQSPITPETTSALITTLLGPSLLGQSFHDIAYLNERMQKLMQVRGHFGGFYLDAIAGLDTALWDLKGRLADKPVSALLGDVRRSRLPAYVSGLRQKTDEERITAAKGFINRGFAGVKIFTGRDMGAAEGLVRAVRDAIGCGNFLAMDALWSFDLQGAAHLGGVLEELKGDWLEAPMHPQDVEAHVALRKMTSTPIAVGEMLRTPWEFEPWFRARALSVAQPDVMRCGITGTMEIARAAKALDMPVALHVGVSTGVGVAATWQVAAVMANDLPQEHQLDLFEVANSLLKTPLEECAGELTVPQRSGIGVEVNEEAVRRYSVEHWIVDAKGRNLAGGHA